MDLIKILVIDDEYKARQVLVALLEKYCPGEMAIEQADSIQSAIDRINRNPPHLLLLDIRLQDGNGFDLLEKVQHLPLQVVFVSAYEEYAIRACKASALDYLLKPVDPDELKVALEKARRKILREKLAERVEQLVQNLGNELESKRIILKTAGSIHVVNIADIVYCQADGNYTVFHLAKNKSVMVSKPLAEYEEILGNQKFIRTHQSYLVNMQYVARYEKIGGGCIVTTDGHTIPVSTRKKELVLQYLQNL